LFSAIMMTINPVYSYKDENGYNVVKPLMEKDSIPKNAKRTLKKFNICDNRVNSLQKGQDKPIQPQMNQNAAINNQNNVVINPNICSFNLMPNNAVKNLEDEPGIKELMQLYLDDNYDYSTGIFTGMTDETKKIFERDLKTFYTAFTGKEEMDATITKFSDIKLKDFNSMKGCQGSNPVYKTPITLNKNDKLFIKYAENIKSMLNSTKEKQNELLEIINVLFTFVYDPYTGKKKIRVNPKLNETVLQKAVDDARKIIIQLYVKCEYDFLEGLKIYEAIVDSKIIRTTENQINTLNKEQSDTISKAIKTPSPIQQPAPVEQITQR